MSIAEDNAFGLRRERRRKDARDYALAFWITFPVFLMSVAMARLVRRRGGDAAAAPRQSIFREAWVAANSSIPFAFMN